MEVNTIGYDETSVYKYEERRVLMRIKIIMVAVMKKHAIRIVLIMKDEIKINIYIVAVVMKHVTKVFVTMR